MMNEKEVANYIHKYHRRPGMSATQEITAPTLSTMQSWIVHFIKVPNLHRSQCERVQGIQSVQAKLVNLYGSVERRKKCNYISKIFWPNIFGGTAWLTMCFFPLILVSAPVQDSYEKQLVFKSQKEDFAPLFSKKWTNMLEVMAN